MDVSTILRIGTGKPAELRDQLSDPHSRFYKETGLTPEDPIVGKLRQLSAGGELAPPHNFNTRPAEALGLTIGELRRLGLGTEYLSLMITVPDSNGHPVQLIPGEFNAWQGTAKGGNVASNPGVFVDEWAASVPVMIQDAGPRYRAGTQGYHVESPTGEQRIVRAGRTVTRPYGDMSYGSTEIIDRDPRSPTYGQPANMGDGAQDVWIPSAILNGIKDGVPYYGPVVVKLRTEGSRSDPQVFYGVDGKAAILAESANWQADKMSEVSELAGVRFDPPVQLQEGLIKNLNDTKTTYIPMNGTQYQAWKHALSEDARLRTTSPMAWIRNTFGSLEKFQATFPDNGGKELTRPDYHRAMGERKRSEVAPVTPKTDFADTLGDTLNIQLAGLSFPEGITPTPEGAAPAHVARPTASRTTSV